MKEFATYAKNALRQRNAKKQFSYRNCQTYVRKEAFTSKSLQCRRKCASDHESECDKLRPEQNGQPTELSHQHDGE